MRPPIQSRPARFVLGSLWRILENGRAQTAWLTSQSFEDAESIIETRNDRAWMLLQQLRETQELLSPKQDDLLRAVLLNDSREGSLREEVSTLSEVLMRILDELQHEMERQRVEQ